MKSCTGLSTRHTCPAWLQPPTVRDHEKPLLCSPSISNSQTGKRSQIVEDVDIDGCDVVLMQPPVHTNEIQLTEGCA